MNNVSEWKQIHYSYLNMHKKKFWNKQGCWGSHITEHDLSRYLLFGDELCSIKLVYFKQREMERPCRQNGCRQAGDSSTELYTGTYRVRSWRNRSLEYTEIQKAFFTPHHAGHSCTSSKVTVEKHRFPTMSLGHCCTNVIRCRCCASIFQQWYTVHIFAQLPWPCRFPTS
jgi:hypothetical protein